MNEDLVHQLWAWIIPGYFFTVIIETSVLLIGLSPCHTWQRRLAAGFWLNASSYPIVIIAMPILIGMEPRWGYLTVAETYAPLVECTLFALAFHTAAMTRAERRRDLITITLANLASFLFGECCHYWNLI